MKYIKYLIITLIIFIASPIVSHASNKVDLYLFHSETCIHCKNEIEYLNSISSEYYFEVHYFEVSKNTENQDLMHQIKDTMGVSDPYVPYLVIGSKAYTGFNDNIKEEIIKSIENYDYDGCNVVDSVINNKPVCFNNEIKEETKKENTTFVIPLVGSVDVKKVSLPFLSVVIGFVDGFNPCAMWVLLFLISVLLGMKNRKRMWTLGLTFLLTSAFVYYLLMASWLNIAISISQINIIRILIALVAIIGGLINLRSFTKKSDTGCEVVDDKKRKKIFARIKKFTSEKSFVLAIIGIMGIAVSVNVIELACSAGLPLLFTQILAINKLNSFYSNILMILYIFFFLLDDLIVFFIAMKTLNIKGISTKYSKYSHLIGGIIMLIIGILLIVKPEWIMFNF